MIHSQHAHRAAANSTFDMWKALGVRFIETETLALVHSGIAYDMFNRAIVKDPLAFDITEIDAIEASFDGMPHSWVMRTSARDAEFAGLFYRRGLAPIGIFAGMILNLRSHPAVPSDSCADSCEIELLSNGSSLCGLEAIFRDAWYWPDSALQYFIDLHIKSLSRAPAPFIHFQLTARESQQRRPVSVGSLLLDGSVVGLYNIATHRGMRGRGFASALIMRMLDEAKKRGHTHACLLAFPGVDRLYARLGFETVCHFQIFSPKAT